MIKNTKNKFFVSLKIFRDNKKAWLRIAEAFLAILLISGFFIFFYVRNIEAPKRADEVYNIEKTILDDIAFDETLRNAVLGNQIDVVNQFVAARVSSTGFNFTVKICETGDICGLPVYQKEYFARDRIISSNLTQYTPKKVKIFMWLEK